MWYLEDYIIVDSRIALQQDLLWPGYDKAILVIVLDTLIFHNTNALSSVRSVAKILYISLEVLFRSVHLDQASYYWLLLGVIFSGAVDGACLLWEPEG